MNLKNFAFEIFRPYLRYIFIMCLVDIVYGCYIGFAPYLLKIIIDDLASGRNVIAVYTPAMLYVGLYFLTAISFRFYDWAKYKMLPNSKKDTAMHMFNYIKNHSHEFFQNNFTGSISNKVNDMIVNLESLLMSGDEFFVSIISFLIAIIVMYNVNPIFAGALFTWWVLFFMVSTLFSKQAYRLSIVRSESYTAYAGRLVDVFANIPSVRLFSRCRYETESLGDAIEDLVVKDRAMMKYVLKMRLAQDVTLVLLLAFMVGLLLHLYQQKLVTIGDFALIITITTAIFQAMWHVANNILNIYQGIGRCQQAFTLLATTHGVIDRENAKELCVSKGAINFHNVSFSYANSAPIFMDKTIEIAPGAKIGLVGYSGSGKSTLVNLLLRNYDLNGGQILIDGQDIAAVTQESLRSNISVIPQDISLFHRSLRDNIKYGNVNASDDEVIAASKLAHCHEFISKLPDGYATLVGERGIKLSGGQRQRIAIARSFLENAPILVLDEATSSLDSVTEKQIQESLSAAMQQNTAIVIAHRLATLLELDRILVFNNGKIIEDGSHKELLAIKGHYAKMWLMQSDGFLPESS
jgi:ATP-binding cassette, subfamily B, bacterial